MRLATPTLTEPRGPGLEPRSGLHLEGHSLGLVAARALSRAAHGQVLARFETSFYVAFADQLLCIGTEALPNGPLNLSTSAPVSTSWPASGLRVGDHVRLRAGTLYVHPTLSIGTRLANPWSPISPAFPESAGAIGRAVDEMCRLARSRLPGEGFAPLLRRDQGRTLPLVATTARPLVRAAGHWLRQGLAHPTFEGPDPSPWVRPLMGLGPGLTPSGDDFLGGALITLHALKAPTLAHRLSIATALGTSHGISAAHLAAAGRDGAGAEALHLMLAALASGRSARIDAALGAVQRTGHTSGWDALVGIVAVLRAWEARDHRAPNRINTKPSSADMRPCRDR